MKDSIPAETIANLGRRDSWADTEFHDENRAILKLACPQVDTPGLGSVVVLFRIMVQHLVEVVTRMANGTAPVCVLEYGKPRCFMVLVVIQNMP